MGEHGGIQQQWLPMIDFSMKRSIMFISITAVGGAGGGGYGAIVAANDVNQSGGSTSNSDPHDMDDRSLSSADGRQSRESGV